MPELLNVLLVEDDEVDREALHRLLDGQYCVREAPSGALAMLACQAARPDCVLLDIRLPDIDGPSLLPLFVKEHIPVIIITSEEKPEIVVSAIQRGAQNYLVKEQISRVALDHAIRQAIEKVSLQRTLEEKNAQLRGMASALTLAEQRERRRISLVLHDHVQQVLHGVQVRAHLIKLDMTDDTKPSIHAHLDAIESLVSEALEATRTLTVELSPPVLQKDGLIPALRWLTNHMAKVHNLHVLLTARVSKHVNGDDVSVLLFELTREVLFNVVKHAQVSEARLEILEQDEHLVVRVQDNGLGFDTRLLNDTRRRSTGLGLRSINERLSLFGGHLEVESKVGAGTIVTIVVPKDIENQAD